MLGYCSEIPFAFAVVLFGLIFFSFCTLLHVPLGVFSCFSSAVLLRSKSINVSEFSIALNPDRSCFPHDTKKNSLSGTEKHKTPPQNNCIHYSQGIDVAHWPFVENEILSWNGHGCQARMFRKLFSSWSSLIAFAVLVLGTYWVSPSLECLTHHAGNPKHDKPAVPSCCWSIMIDHCQGVKLSKSHFHS